MVIECTNCGNKLSDKYARVMLPEDMDNVPACKECPDRKLTESGQVLYDQ